MSPRQIERWRQRGLLPELPRRALGRGAGSQSWVTEELIDQACVVADAVGKASSLHEAALTLFVARCPVAERAVRLAYRAALEGFVGEIEAAALADEDLYDTLDRVGQMLAGRRTDGDSARWHDRLSKTEATLADANFAALVAAITGRVPTPESLDALASAVGANAMTEERVADVGPVAGELDFAGIEEVIATTDVFTLLRVCDEVEFDQLCAARDFFLDFRELACALLAPAAHGGAPEALGLRELALQTDFQLALLVLAAMPMFEAMEKGVAEWSDTFRTDTPRLWAASRLLEAMPSEDREAFAIMRADGVDALPAAQREELSVFIDEWMADNRADASALLDT